MHDACGLPRGIARGVKSYRARITARHDEFTMMYITGTQDNQGLPTSTRFHRDELISKAWHVGGARKVCRIEGASPSVGPRLDPGYLSRASRLRAAGWLPIVALWRTWAQARTRALDSSGLESSRRAAQVFLRARGVAMGSDQYGDVCRRCQRTSRGIESTGGSSCRSPGAE